MLFNFVLRKYYYPDNAIYSTVTPTSFLSGKSVTGVRLNVATF